MTAGREGALRVDVLLDRLCLTRSRSEAKSACDSGAVSVGGQQAKANQSVAIGDRIAIEFPGSSLEIEVVELPPKSTSRTAAREMYRVIRTERTS